MPYCLGDDPPKSAAPTAYSQLKKDTKEKIRKETTTGLSRNTHHHFMVLQLYTGFDFSNPMMHAHKLRARSFFFFLLFKYVNIPQMIQLLGFFKLKVM